RQALRRRPPDILTCIFVQPARPHGRTPWDSVLIASERDGITAVMWKLALPGLIVGLVGCWTSSQPTSPTQPPPASASTGGAAYGGAVYGDSLARGDTYGGATYGGGTYGGATYGVLGVLQQPGQVG